MVAVTPVGALESCVSPTQKPVTTAPAILSALAHFTLSTFPAGAWTNNFFHPSLPLHTQT